MIFDKQANFDWKNAITVTRNSTDVIDLGVAGRDIANADDLWLVGQVTTAFVTGDAAVLSCAVVDDDNAALSSPATVLTLMSSVAAATLVAGYSMFKTRLPIGRITQRYLGLVWTVGTGSFSAGAVVAALTPNVDAWKTFPAGYTNY